MSTIVNLPTTPSSTPGAPLDALRSHYLITFPGLLKVVQLILDGVCFVRMRTVFNTEHSRAFWLSFAAGSGFCVTTMLFLFFCFSLIKRQRKLVWVFESVYSITWCLFLLVTSVIVFIYGIKHEGYITSSVFGLLAAIAYGIDAFFKCRSWMRNDFTFGDKHVFAAISSPNTRATTVNTTSVTTPVSTVTTPS